MGNPIYWVLGTVLLAAIVAGLAYGLATKRFGRYGPYIVGVFAFVVLWTVWPYWAIYDLQSALVRGDKVRLSSLVDWSQVREGVREDMKAAFAGRLVGGDPRSRVLGQALGSAAIDRIVETQINPAMLSEVAKGGRTDPDPMGQVRYAFFEGSPLVFRMDIGSTFSTQEERTIYLLEWNLGWKLKRIIIAPYLLER